ncbi:MAG: hypothetical protein FJ297_04200 [Planctomycetes bacterium]|nr:hypothetical protein [Planctomycetota bacterium]
MVRHGEAARGESRGHRREPGRTSPVSARIGVIAAEKGRIAAARELRHSGDSPRAAQSGRSVRFELTGAGWYICGTPRRGCGTEPIGERARPVGSAF